MRRRALSTLTALATLGGALLAAPALSATGQTLPEQAGGPKGTPPGLFERDLTGPELVSRGLVAVRKVAAVNDTAEDRLAELLADRSVRVARDGRIWYADFELTGSESTAPVTSFAAPFPYTDTFRLHSKPGASRVIYLDVNGHTITGTAWNQSFNQTTINAAAYSLDADPTTFTTAEQDAIQSIWQRVAEDFAPFDVDVTTEDPGPDAITRNGSTDAAFGTRALITNSPIGDDCDPATTGLQPCGGIAYIGVFDETSSHAYYQPALVFSNKLGNDTKNIAEAASHEVGHNLGLRHDGTSTVGYYRGHGAWAPIMGVGYDRPISQWSRGEYSGATNLEDDLAVIVANGAPIRSDDHGDTPGVATALGSGPSLSATGNITTRTEVDTFSFVAGAGPATINVLPAAVAPNLDVRATLRDAAGAVVAEADPPSTFLARDSASGLGATINATLAAGTYTLTVDGVGFGLAGSTGYSDYGSLGVYTITGQVTTSTTPPPPADLQATVDDVTVAEGTAAGNTATVTVRLDRAADRAVTVAYGTAAGVPAGQPTSSGATPGTDFVSASGSLSFAVGEQVKSFTVSTVADTAVEPNEYLAVVLSNPSTGLVLARSTGYVTITNDDAAPVVNRAVSVVDRSVLEGRSGKPGVAITVSLDAPATTPVTVRFRTVTGGTATAGSDYTAVSATVSFAVGERTKTVAVPVWGDRTREASETVSLLLDQPSANLTIARPSGTLTITNDD